MQRFIFSFFVLFSFLKASAQSGNFLFTENKGQWDSRVKFFGELTAGALFLEADGYTVLLHEPSELQNILHRHHAGAKKDTGSLNNNLQETVWLGCPLAATGVVNFLHDLRCAGGLGGV